jgi:hypothetical protein
MSRPVHCQSGSENRTVTTPVSDFADSLQDPRSSGAHIGRDRMATVQKLAEEGSSQRTRRGLHQGARRAAAAEWNGNCPKRDGEPSNAQADAVALQREVLPGGTSTAYTPASLPAIGPNLTDS